MNRYLTLAILLSGSATYGNTHPVPTVEWTQQVWPIIDASFPRVSVSADSQGAAFLATSTGNYEPHVVKFDATGDIVWSRIGGTGTTGGTYDVSVDALGNVFTGGYTDSGEDWDGFVTKYDPDGAVQWTRYITTPGRPSNVHAAAVSADPFGNVFVSGRAEGSLSEEPNNYLASWVKKYDADGDELWTQEFATWSDAVGAIVTADPFGNVYMTGRTQLSSGEPIGQWDTFLTKYDANGSLLWTRQLGTEEWDFGNSVSADALGNVFIAGRTDGNLGGANQGSSDIFVSKFDSEGNFHWTRQLGSGARERAESVVADGLGNFYISGFTDGNLGEGDLERRDVFLAKYDADGSLLWGPQLYGTDRTDDDGRMAIDGLGNIFISGARSRGLPATSSQGWEAFLIKLNDPTAIPEPSTGMLLLMAAAVIGSRRRTYSSPKRFWINRLTNHN